MEFRKHFLKEWDQILARFAHFHFVQANRYTSSAEISIATPLKHARKEECHHMQAKINKNPVIWPDIFQ